MSKDKYQGYETLNISPSDLITECKYKFAESDWMVFADGITKTAYEYNRKTGEKREYDYDKAWRAMAGYKE